MQRKAAMCWLLLAAGMTSGCVERRYVITSDPPGALVYRNGKPIGTTPVDDYFVYYGKYHFTLVKDGYETLQVEENFDSPWYEYPPLDLFAENFWPFKVRDVRRPSYQLQPLRQVRHDEVLNRANELRARGQTLTPFAPVPPRGGRPQAPAAGPIVTPPPGAVIAPPSGAVIAPPPSAVGPPVGSTLVQPPVNTRPTP